MGVRSGRFWRAGRSDSARVVRSGSYWRGDSARGSGLGGSGELLEVIQLGGQVWEVLESW